jgi:hypothetical protein
MEIDFHERSRQYFGMHEHELNRYFRLLVKPGDNCFDIGGNEGYDALMLANLSHGRVASFECDPAEAKKMRHNFEINPRLSIQVVEAFVGHDNENGSISIDHAARDLFAPNFIKMDIEGAEDAALEDASETLTRHHPKFIIEVHGADKEEKCISILKQFGYRPQVVEQDWLFRDSARRGFNRWVIAA